MFLQILDNGAQAVQRKTWIVYFEINLLKVHVHGSTVYSSHGLIVSVLHIKDFFFFLTTMNQDHNWFIIL